MKKNLVCSVQYVHSNPNNILLLTSRGFASKVQTLFLTLKLLNSKDCKKAALSKTYNTNRASALAFFTFSWIRNNNSAKVQDTDLQQCI